MFNLMKRYYNLNDYNVADIKYSKGFIELELLGRFIILDKFHECVKSNLKLVHQSSSTS